MKVSIIIFCAAVLTASAIPRPAQNKNDFLYSRYVWMSNDEGIPQLVDLKAPVDTNFLNIRNGANNAYWLYTRNNRNNPQQIVNGDANSLQNSFYDADQPLNVLVHGWTGSLSSPMNDRIADALLEVDNANVIVVDWNALAGANYVTAVAGVPSVGQHLGNFLEWLLSTGGGNWNNVHLIGFSLGAHVVGNAGRQTNGRPRRITGLDPAGPLWYTNSAALNRNSGQYVEVIHTNIYLLGISSAIGHTDFYPNGGMVQPECGTDPNCSHGRSYELFASSVRTNHFVGRLCENRSQAINQQCSGSTFNMGNSILNKNGNGIYGLNTGGSWPF